MKKRFSEAHAPPSSKGMGDYYGQGIRAKVGKIRDVYGFDTIIPKKLKKPPKSLA